MPIQSSDDMAGENTTRLTFETSIEDSTVTPFSSPSPVVSISVVPPLDPGKLTYGKDGLSLERYLQSESCDPQSLDELKKSLG
jgi:hypothetical protein